MLTFRRAFNWAAASALTIGVAAGFGLAPAFAQTIGFSSDGKNVGYTPSPFASARAHTDADLANARSRLPMLKDLSHLSSSNGNGPNTMAYGSLKHPFTTKGAYSTAGNGSPVFLNPWRATGKLIMTVPNQCGPNPPGTYICTASVIEKGILVTAAHCVHCFGQRANGFASALSFQPARHGGQTKYGTWTAATWFIPTSYFNGSDNCAQNSPGVVCENDIAIVVMNTGPAPHTGKDIAQVVGRYGYYKNNQGYANFLGKMATQITQLGYPGAFDQGLKMIRTDSMGYQAAPSNVLIGSDQTGGSSGGPWIMNFGIDPQKSSGTTPSFNVRNKVVATTSWGYGAPNATEKVMGASRFANNAAYPAPGPTNIESLIASGCNFDSSKCF